ncbi:hypothetical protein [Clostridium sp. JS66]|uniref:hypothetical protein n=1 Tax=Clostridium sp. JS66 TaxID=3064705 RepID=UPI00298DEB6C|nr:hypothetical protein [Clostridium sp. JS66]WPC42821.1 hypothetical protein Q6H37_04950 [Clostridium sp. JS66]
MKIDEFFESTIYNKLDFKVQELLQDLIQKLGDLDYVIIRRNDKALVLKVRGMYENNPRSKANIATIRLKQGYITVGPYKNNDENIVTCRSKDDINVKLIEDIKSIYREKL